jgi:hypothetical protein
MKKVVQLTVLVLVVIFAMGFQCGSGPPVPPAVGFQVHTLDEANLFGTLQDSPNIDVLGNWQEDVVLTPAGTFRSFFGRTDDNGFYNANGVVAPANWQLSEPDNGPCAGGSVVVTVGQGQTQDLDCIGTVLGFQLIPGVIDSLNPPNSLQVNGANMMTTYGMPNVQIFDSLGNQIANVIAMSVTNNGSVLTCPMPALPSTLRTGTYGLEVMNVQSNGSLSPAGALAVPIYGAEPRVGVGGGGSGHCGHQCQ